MDLACERVAVVMDRNLEVVEFRSIEGREFESWSLLGIVNPRKNNLGLFANTQVLRKLNQCPYRKLLISSRHEKFSKIW